MEYIRLNKQKLFMRLNNLKGEQIGWSHEAEKNIGLEAKRRRQKIKII